MTASPSALAAAAATGLALPAQAFLAAIAEGEGGDLPNRLYSYGVLEAEDPRVGSDAKGRLWLGDLSVFPGWHGASTADGRISTAAGWLQFTRTTWFRVAAKTGKRDYAADYMANGWWLAQDDFRRRSGRDLLAALTMGQLSLIHTYLGMRANGTWPGGADLGFLKRYPKNLAALQAPPSPPKPASLTLTLPPTLIADGEFGPVVIELRLDAPAPPMSARLRLPAIAGAAALLLALSGSQRIMPGETGGMPREPATPSPFVWAALPAAEPPAYSGPTWRFGQNEASRLTVECRQPDGTWLPCPPAGAAAQ